MCFALKIIFFLSLFTLAGCSFDRDSGHQQEGRSVHDMPLKFTGIWYVWHEDGNIAAKYEYRNGSPYGLRQEWNREGVLVLEETWDGLRVVGTYREWYPSGQLKHLIEYGDGNAGVISAKAWNEDGTEVDPN